MQVAIASLGKTEGIGGNPHHNFFVNPYHRFIDSNFDWACDACLRSQRAIQAQPALQNYCWNPHYAYFDTTFVCRTCQNEFVFGKTEKQYWFETLKFWIEAIPVNCPACRKDLRQQKAENDLLSTILRKAEHDISEAELVSVIAIYLKWQKVEKVRYYKSLLKKRHKR